MKSSTGVVFAHVFALGCQILQPTGKIAGEHLLRGPGAIGVWIAFLIRL